MVLTEPGCSLLRLVCHCGDCTATGGLVVSLPKLQLMQPYGCVKLCIEEAASLSVAATLKITRAGQPHDPVPPLCLSGLAEQGLHQYVSMLPARGPWSGAVRALGQQTKRRHHP